MHKIWQKGCAMVLASFMVLTALVVIATPAKADWDVREDWIELVFNDNTMIDGLAGDYEETVYDGSSSFNQFRVGEGDGVLDWDSTGDSNYLWITLNLVDGGNMGDLFINVTDAASGSFDFDDSGDTTTPDAFPVASDNNFLASPGIGTEDFGWDFDILRTNVLGYSAQTEITISYSYLDTTDANPANWARRTGNFNIYVSLSSFFDVGNDNEVDVLDDLYDNDDDDAFEAGDMFADTALDLYNPSNEALDDMTCELTPPAGITLAGDGTCWIPDGIASYDGETMYFRSNIDARLAPGIHTGTAVFTYTRMDSGLVCTETHDVNWPVDFNFADDDPGNGDIYAENQIRATEVVITDDGTGGNETNTTRQINIFPLPSDDYEQSTFSDKLITLDVTVENNGNSDLYNVEFEFAPTGWDFFRDPTFFWPTTAGPEYDGTWFMLDEFPVGATETFTIQVIVVKEVPIGEHRLPLVYNGFYFNDGSLGDATEFAETNGGDDLEVYFSVFVTDGALDCYIDNVWVPDGADYNDDITYFMIDVDIYNLEGYAFIDVLAWADFTGTPFYDPIVTERDANGMIDYATVNRVIPAEENPTDYWGYAGGTDDELDLAFMVDSQVDLIPDLYPFTVTVTAIIEETLEEVTTTIGGVIEIQGYGPRVYISAFTTSDIEAGNFFDLNMTVSNDGDDDLRDTWVYIAADDTVPAGYLYDEIICDVIGQIQRESEGYSEYEDWSENYSWDGAEVTLEDLDIDSAKEIVALNLYLDGVYSSPGAVITLLYIGTIAAGETVNVDFQMMADKDMVDGKPYMVTVEVYGIDSEGDEWDGSYDIIVKTSKDSAASYNPTEMDLFMGGMQIMGLILFIVIVVAILFYVLRKVIFPPKKEEPKAPQ